MTYFVTENYIKELTPITSNVEFSEFEPMVRTQAEMRVQPILGSYFFKYLLNQYNNTLLTPSEVSLVELIQPVIAWSVCAESALITSYQLKNKGIQVQSGDYSQPAQLQEVNRIVSDFRQKSEFYENRLKFFLKENKLNYPQFISDLNKDSDLFPNIDSSDGFYGNFMMFT